MFERIYGKLKAKNCFQKQSFTKYLGLNLVFMCNSAKSYENNFDF